MLRIHGPEVYDQWTSHEIPFNDPRVVEALDHLGELLLTEGNVLGGSQTILNTEFSEASLPLFEDPPRAMLHRQGNFVTGDRKSTRLNSSHVAISYAVFCLKKKKKGV